jgi:hypothetical protein
MIEQMIFILFLVLCKYVGDRPKRSTGRRFLDPALQPGAKSYKTNFAPRFFHRLHSKKPKRRIVEKDWWIERWNWLALSTSIKMEEDPKMWEGRVFTLPKHGGLEETEFWEAVRGGGLASEALALCPDTLLCIPRKTVTPPWCTPLHSSPSKIPFTSTHGLCESSRFGIPTYSLKSMQALAIEPK